LVKGFQKLQRDDRIQALMTGLATEEVLPLDRDAAAIAGRIYGEFERSGQTIGRLDPLIAGIAIQHGLLLITGNTKHSDFRYGSLTGEHDLFADLAPSSNQAALPPGLFAPSGRTRGTGVISSS